YALVRHLVEERARVTISAIDPVAMDRAAHAFGVDTAPVEKIHAVECDIYAPCALGGALNPATVPELRCAAVVGSANNQLADPSCVDLLHEANVVYAPDYVVNAGGLINISEELWPGGYHRERAYTSVRRVADNTEKVLAIAEADGVSTAAAADRL